MKKLCFIISAILAAVLLFNSITAFAGTEDDRILTLEEAKALAAENDEEFQRQQKNIEKANENYEKVYEANTGSIKTVFRSVAEQAEYIINRKIAIENAALNTRLAIFRRDAVRKNLDYKVTAAYYDVIKSYYKMENSGYNIDIKKNELDKAKSKYSLGLIKKSALTDAENAYRDAQKAYDDAFYDLQQKMNALGRIIGRKLDAYNDKLDMTLSMADISTVDLNKIKEDYMKNNESYYKAKEEMLIAEYKYDLFKEQYDYYYKKLSSLSSSKILDELEDMLYDAEEEYLSAKDSYEEMEQDLDDTLVSQYRTLNDLYDTCKELEKKIEESKQAFENNKIKYGMRLISKADLDRSETSIRDLQNQLNTAIMNLNLQYLNMMQYSTD